MARKPKLYEVDFRFPRSPHVINYGPGYSDLYTAQQHIHFFEASNPSPDNRLIPIVQRAKKLLLLNSDLDPSVEGQLRHKLACFTPAWESFNQNFFRWFLNRPDIQELYKAAASQTDFFRVPHEDSHVPHDIAASRGWLNSPPNWFTAVPVLLGPHALKYAELHKPAPFSPDDCVQLRSTCENAAHDPYRTFHGPKTGVVIRCEDHTHPSSRSASGSRAISVRWNPPDPVLPPTISSVPARTLKLLAKPPLAPAPPPFSPF